jgi:hypothetical protein
MNHEIFEVLKAVKMMMILRVAMKFRALRRYKFFEQAYCLHLQG